jgi:hypothetical protein
LLPVGIRSGCSIWAGTCWVSPAGFGDRDHASLRSSDNAVFFTVSGS